MRAAVGLELAREAARELRKQCGVRHQRYVDLDRIVLYLKIQIRIVPLEGARAQLVRVRGRRSKILLSDRLDRPEQRFSIAHEIGHLLLEHRSSDLRGQHGPCSCGGEIEAEADRFAIELLLPEHVVRPGSMRSAASIDAALRLAHTFGVPAFAGALRCADLSSAPCAVALSDRGWVRWARANAAFSGVITDGARLDVRTLASDCLATGEVLTGLRRVPASAWLATPCTAWLLEQSIPSHDGTVLTMLWPSVVPGP